MPIERHDVRERAAGVPFSEGNMPLVTCTFCGKTAIRIIGAPDTTFAHVFTFDGKQGEIDVACRARAKVPAESHAP